MVMDETYVINQLKENLCFVSNQFMADMEIARLQNIYTLTILTLMNFHGNNDHIHLKNIASVHQSSESV